MRKLGIITIFVLAVIAVFLWTAGNITDQVNRTTGDSTPQYGIGGGPGVDMNSATGGTTLDESAGLNALFQEHAIQAGFHLQDLYDGKDTTETAGKLQNNSIKIADFFESGLGVDKNAFLSMWDGHIREYENYTNNLKAGDRNGTAEVRSTLNEHAMMMGSLINRARPDIPASEIARLMNEHFDLTLSVIEAYAAGDTSTKLSQASKASAQAVAFADAIIDAIEKGVSPAPSPGL